MISAIVRVSVPVRETTSALRISNSVGFSIPEVNGVEGSLDVSGVSGEGRSESRFKSVVKIGIDIKDGVHELPVNRLGTRWLSKRTLVVIIGV